MESNLIHLTRNKTRIDRVKEDNQSITILAIHEIEVEVALKCVPVTSTSSPGLAISIKSPNRMTSIE